MALLTSMKLHIALLAVISLTGVAKNEALILEEAKAAYVGSPATLTCPLQSASCTEIQWKKGKGPPAVEITDRVKYEFTDCDLVIKDLTSEDASFYQCTISGSSEGVYLFVIVPEPQPTCTTDPPSTIEDLAEGDTVKYTCEARVHGFREPRVKWFRKDSELADNSEGDGNIVTLSISAKAPKVQTMLCYAIFNVGETVVRVKVCETKEFYILYSVRNVLTWPLLYVGPGETLTCSADANPLAAFAWLAREEGEKEWTRVAIGKTVVAELKNGTSSAVYKCVAENVVRKQLYQQESAEVTLTKHGKAIRTAIIVSVVIVVVVLVIIGVVVWLKCFRE